jgi:hypothetical protein
MSSRTSKSALRDAHICKQPSNPAEIPSLAANAARINVLDKTRRRELAVHQESALNAPAHLTPARPRSVPLANATPAAHALISSILRATFQSGGGCRRMDLVMRSRPALISRAYQT